MRRHFSLLYRKNFVPAPIQNSFVVLKLCPFYDTAGNSCTGVAGRLRSKIIRCAVDQDGFSYDFTGRKFMGQKNRESIAVISKKRWQISCMIRVVAHFRVIMRHCLTEGINAVSGAYISLVDMISKDGILTIFP